MRFEWDNKRQTDLRKHGIYFAEVWQVFKNERATDVEMILAIAHMEDDDKIRLISA